MTQSSTHANLSFVPPPPAFTNNVEDVLQEIIRNATEETSTMSHVPHLHRGYWQLTTSMQSHNSDCSTFTDWIKQENEQWKDQLEHAQLLSKQVQIKTRPIASQVTCIGGLEEGYDISVGKRGRPDDSVYADNDYCRQYLPRGNFICKIVNDEKQEALYFPVIRGLRKFSGQEDDGELQIKNVQSSKKSKNKKQASDTTATSTANVGMYFSQPKANATSVIRTSKANGEAAHVRVFKRSDDTYLYAIGSKNTHFFLSSEDDISTSRQHSISVTGNDPFPIAADIAQAFFHLLSTLSEDKRRVFCDFLWQTSATACFEILCLDHQHVQKLSDIVSRNTLVLYGLVLPHWDLLHTNDEVCLNPVLAYDLFQHLGVSTVDFQVFDDLSELDKEMKRLKYTTQVEGSVLLYVDADGSVMGLEKHKSVWYVCLRAIREKAKSLMLQVEKSKGQDAISKVSNQLQSRFTKIQQFLDISTQTMTFYRDLGLRFLRFVIAHNVDKRRVADLFPEVWSDFLHQTNVTDHLTHDKIES